MSNFPTLSISATQTINASRPLINTYLSASKTAIDNHVAGSADKHDAAHIVYSGNVTGTVTVESALDTIDTRIDDHVGGIAEKHPASAITYSGSITGVTTVESALYTVNARIDERVNSSATTLDARISAHVTGSSEKHYASDIIYSGSITAATTTESAIDTVNSRIADHVAGTAEKHDSIYIDYTGTLTSSTTVESAINTVYQMILDFTADTSGSTAEVIAARTAVNGESYATLGDRLDSIENMAGNVLSKTADITLLTSERGIIKVTNATANITITLPSSATTHIAYTIKKTFTGSETVTIVATAGQTIDGTTAGQTLTSQYDMVTVLSDGSNWNIIGGDTHLIVHKTENAIDAHATMPNCRVYNNANISVANSANATLSFNSERFDTDNIHDTVTNNSRLTCKTAGKYYIQASVVFETNATGIRSIDLVINGVTSIGSTKVVAINGDTVNLQVSAIYELAVNDYVTVTGYQNSGGDLNVRYVGNISPEFMMAKIG